MASLFLLLFLIEGCLCLQWSPEGLKGGEHVTLCRGAELNLDWRLDNVTDNPASIVVIQFYFKGRSDELIAIVSHGLFTVTPSYHGRVELVNQTGLRIRGLTAGNDGVYSIEVNGKGANGQFLMLRRNATLTVVDGLQTSGGQLHASLAPAERDAVTGITRAALTCGTFLYAKQPAFDLIWTTPSGQQLPSSDYQYGQYRLLLPNPVQSGDYSCFVPAEAAALACNHDHNDSAVVTVDGVEVRLAMLEAQVTGLEADKTQLKDQVTWLNGQVASLEKTNDRLEANVSRLDSENVVLSQKLSELDDKMAVALTNVTSSLQELNSTASTPRVSFMATHLQSFILAQGDRLVFDHVALNQGGSYGNTSGVFTAPKAGVYIFHASLVGFVSGIGHENVHVGLYNDNVKQLETVTNVYMEEDWESMSFQAILHLQVGARVWLRASGIENRFVCCDYNSFSGVLVTQDA